MLRAIVLLLTLPTLVLAEEAAIPTADTCLLATKKYSQGAVVVDNGVALLCQAGGRWRMGDQVVHCLSQGKAHSDGGRIVAPGPNGPIIQVCTKGRWTDQHTAAPASEASF